MIKVVMIQGWAETGPRALGHRSIFVNPRDAHALDRINQKVKVVLDVFTQLSPSVL